MNGIDELLRDATTRLDHAVSSTIAPELGPAPGHHGRLAVRLACVVVLGAAGYAISTRVTNSETATALPPGLLDGRYGTQITITEVADGDNDPQTFSLRAEPDAGTVKVTKPATGTGPTTINGGSQDFSLVELCLSSSSAGDFCGPRDLLMTPQFIVSSRGPQGQAVVVGAPAGTAAIIFTAGSTILWAEPLHGIVAFPFPESSAASASAEAIDSNGLVIWQQSASDAALTPSEVANATVTEPTNDILANGYFGDVGQSGYGP
ncbi:MAG: hypothetical protein ABI862_13600, partial [Ilumatobacteraceae bacterium]